MPNVTTIYRLSGNHSDSSSILDSDGAGDITPFEYAAFACSLFMLVSCVVGVFGNAMSVLIFTRPVMRSSINVLLTGLSLIDLLMLATSIPVFVVPNFNMYFKQKLLSESYYLLIVFGPYQFGMIAQTSSVWTFVLISCERYLAVCHPLKVSRLLSVKRARFALVGVVCTAVGYNVVRFFEYRLDAGNQGLVSDSSSEDEEAAGGSPGYVSWLRGERLYFVFYHIGLYLLTHFLGPFVVITVLNVLILLTIKKSRTARAKMIPNSQDSANNNDALLTVTASSSNSLIRTRRSKTKTTQMIVVVTATFLVCNSLPFAINIWEASVPHIFTSEDQNLQASAFMLVDLSNTLVVFNSASTFLLYIIYCKKYRELFKWYSLAPMRLCNKDEAPSRRNSPLCLANDPSNSLDVSRFLNATVMEQRKMGRSSLATAPLVSSTATPFLAINERSVSDGAKSLTSFAQGDPAVCYQCNGVEQ